MAHDMTETTLVLAATKRTRGSDVQISRCCMCTRSFQASMTAVGLARSEAAAPSTVSASPLGTAGGETMLPR
jgi:hypothetical protein